MKLTDCINKEYENLEEKKIILQNGNVQTIEKLTSLHSTWKNMIETVSEEDFTEISNAFAIKKIKKSNIQYTSEDITIFFSELFEKITIDNIENAFSSGILVSALINYHFQKTKQKQPYILFTKNIPVEIDYLCHKNNGAQVCIYGNTGTFLCQQMKNGCVHVDGNADSSAGHMMKGGILKVQSANEYLGEYMSGGKIYVNEDYERFLAQGFEGNETTRFGGEIYCSGKKMFSKKIKMHKKITRLQTEIFSEEKK